MSHYPIAGQAMVVSWVPAKAAFTILFCCGTGSSLGSVTALISAGTNGISTSEIFTSYGNTCIEVSAGCRLSLEINFVSIRKQGMIGFHNINFFSLDFSLCRR
jgi:hypothetical protein